MRVCKCIRMLGRTTKAVKITAKYFQNSFKFPKRLFMIYGNQENKLFNSFL